MLLPAHKLQALVYGILWRKVPESDAWSVASTVLLVLNLTEGADRVGGQIREDKECPFSGVTDSGRVLSKVPEREAWGVLLIEKHSKSEITGGIQENSFSGDRCSVVSCGAEGKVRC